MTTAQRTALSVLTLLSVLAYSGAARADRKIDRAKAVAPGRPPGAATI